MCMYTYISIYTRTLSCVYIYIYMYMCNTRSLRNSRRLGACNHIPDESLTSRARYLNTYLRPVPEKEQLLNESLYFFLLG